MEEYPVSSGRGRRKKYFTAEEMRRAKNEWLKRKRAALTVEEKDKINEKRRQNAAQKRRLESELHVRDEYIDMVSQYYLPQDIVDVERVESAPVNEEIILAQGTASFDHIRFTALQQHIHEYRNSQSTSAETNNAQSSGPQYRSISMVEMANELHLVDNPVEVLLVVPELQLQTNIVKPGSKKFVADQTEKKQLEHVRDTNRLMAATGQFTNVAHGRLLCRLRLLKEPVEQSEIVKKIKKPTRQETINMIKENIRTRKNDVAFLQNKGTGISNRKYDLLRKLEALQTKYEAESDNRVHRSDESRLSEVLKVPELSYLVFSIVQEAGGIIGRKIVWTEIAKEVLSTLSSLDLEPEEITSIRNSLTQKKDHNQLATDAGFKVKTLYKFNHFDKLEDIDDDIEQVIDQYGGHDTLEADDSWNLIQPEEDPYLSMLDFTYFLRAYSYHKKEERLPEEMKRKKRAKLLNLVDNVTYVAAANSHAVKRELEKLYFGQKKLTSDPEPRLSDLEVYDRFVKSAKVLYIGSPTQFETLVNKKIVKKHGRVMNIRVLLIRHFIRIQQRGYFRSDIVGDRCTIYGCNCGNITFSIEFKDWGDGTTMAKSGVLKCTVAMLFNSCIFVDTPESRAFVGKRLAFVYAQLTENKLNVELIEKKKADLYRQLKDPIEIRTLTKTGEPSTTDKLCFTVVPSWMSSDNSYLWKQLGNKCGGHFRCGVCGISFVSSSSDHVDYDLCLSHSNDEKSLENIRQAFLNKTTIPGIETLPGILKGDCTTPLTDRNLDKLKTGAETLHCCMGFLHHCIYW